MALPSHWEEEEYKELLLLNSVSLSDLILRVEFLGGGGGFLSVPRWIVKQNTTIHPLEIYIFNMIERSRHTF